MSYAQERIDIETRLGTNWATTPIAWDNGKYVPTPNVSWIRCTILSGDVEALEFGRATAKEYTGIIDISVFTPKAKGSVTARGYVDTLTTLFSMQEFGSVDCGCADVRNLGGNESSFVGKKESQNNWYVMNISIPFSRIE